MLRAFTRISSFFSQWLAEVLRQPWLMVSLVIGPFLILLAFGEGESIGAPRPRTILVQPPNQGQQGNFAVSPKELSQFLEVLGTTSNVQQAQESLVDGSADLVVVLPGDPTQAVQQGKRAHIHVFTNEIDPIKKSYQDAYIRQQVATLNQETVQKTIADAQQQVGQVHSLVGQAEQYLQVLQSAQSDLGGYRAQLGQLRDRVDSLDASLGQASTVVLASPLAVLPQLQQPLDQLRQLRTSVDNLKSTVDQLNSQLNDSAGNGALPSAGQLAQIRSNLQQIDAAATQFKAVPADVLSAPFELDLKNVAPFVPTAIGFYAPAVLALLLQHLGVTLGALSMSRVRLLGLMELFQTSPVKPLEVVLGNYLSYFVLCAVAGGLLALLLFFALGVPIFGSLGVFVGMLALLIFCSLGIGLVVSLISSSEQQAAQIAMLVLIASVFFSGFLVALDTIDWPVRAISYALPATYAIRTLQDVMLRGVLRTPGDIVTVAGIGVVLFIITVLLLRREFRAR